MMRYTPSIVLAGALLLFAWSAQAISINANGVSGNQVEAAEWYQRTAPQEYADAPDNLSWMRASVEDVARDSAEPTKWTRTATPQGREYTKGNLKTLLQLQKFPKHINSLARGTFSSAIAAIDDGPSESEMLAAVQAKFDQINANYKALGERCERRDFRNNPLVAMQCLQLCAAGGGNCRMAFELTQFERLGCGKAVGEAGYVCDFIVGFSSGSPFAQGAMNQTTGGSNTGKGRFLRRDVGWLFLPIQR